MGVTGAGKTTVGGLLAQQLGWEFVDADDFHSASNLEKMRQGIPLSDDERRPWLEALREVIAKHDARGGNLILACSALKKDYRKMLAVTPAVKFVYLKGDAEQVARRLSGRHGHFATENILAAQFADLEEPDNAVVVDIAAEPESIVQQIREKLGV
jgi:gluconokinase